MKSFGLICFSLALVCGSSAEDSGNCTGRQQQAAIVQAMHGVLKDNFDVLEKTGYNLSPYRGQIRRRTCYHNKTTTFKMNPTVTYQIPDQVMNLTLVDPFQIKRRITVIPDKVNQFINVEIEITFPLAVVTFEPAEANFTNSLDGLGSYTSDETRYITWIQNHGTHFLPTVQLGSKIWFQMTVANNQVAEETLPELAKQYLNVVKKYLGEEVEEEEVGAEDTTKLIEVTFQEAFIGGLNRSLTKAAPPQGIPDLLIQTAVNPAIVAVLMEPITNLIENRTLREQMNLAVAVYHVKEHLKYYLKDIEDWTDIPAAQKEEFIGKVKKAYNEKVPDKKEVESIEKFIQMKWKIINEKMSLKSSLVSNLKQLKRLIEKQLDEMFNETELKESVCKEFKFC